ncbi:MAG: PKD domain-containing protein [Crenarchaeota archaeon]|nr:MAG: PKD domain-containing protein [Thermoproteota archaeon]
MAFRLSSLSTEATDGVDYATGDLSLFPELLDDKDSLYVANNNAETTLKQSLSYNGKQVIVEDASKFPDQGLIRVGNEGKLGASAELIYYGKRNSNTFLNLVRGFAGSRQDVWDSGVKVTNAVMAEHHNAVKDAVLNIENNLGTETLPLATSLNGILKAQENRFLAPNPQFRAYPTSGPPSLKVRFQNFSNAQAIRFLWDFGDGTISDERNPVHIYQTEGIYTVRLNMIMTTGSQGVKIKNNYITVSEEAIDPFFYASKQSGNTYEFVDQTDGDISARYWVFGDGENTQELDPNKHTTQHTYTAVGEYIPSLLIVFKDQSLKRVFLSESIVIT